jgi:hypothetical protein
VQMIFLSLPLEFELSLQMDPFQEANHLPQHGSMQYQSFDAIANARKNCLINEGR